MKKINACPACHQSSLIDFYSVDDVPIQQNTPKATITSALETPLGNIQLAYCESCGFITNRAFDPTVPIYGADYNNNQTYSNIFSDYVQSIIQFMNERYHLKEKHVIEIGSGDGSFLEALYKSSNIYGIGFDPSYTGEETLYNERLKFVRDYYGQNYSDSSADLIIARHLIEHIHDLENLMLGMKNAIGNRNSSLFFETPDVLWILKNVTFWDIFYEHCSLFSHGSIARLFSSYGFNVESVKSAFNEQYMWLDASSGHTNVTYPSDLDTIEKIARLAEIFKKSAPEKIQKLQEQLADWRRVGKRVAVWGAGAKGVTFLNTLKPDLDNLPCVVDINHEKQGHFIPGTGQEIISPELLSQYGIDVIYIMNPNYQDEILTLLSSLHLESVQTIVIE